MLAKELGIGEEIQIKRNKEEKSLCLAMNHTWKNRHRKIIKECCYGWKVGMVAIIILKNLMKKSPGERKQEKWLKIKGTENRVRVSGGKD